MAAWRIILNEWLFLEEEVTLVNDVSIQVQLVHGHTTNHLLSLLLHLLSLLLSVELHTLALLLGQHLEEVGATVTLDDRRTYLSLLDGSHSTTQDGLAGTGSLYEDRSGESNLANAIHDSTLLLGSSHILHASQLLGSLVELLVVDNLLLQFLLDALQVTIALRMNLGQGNNQQMVIVATLIERRDIAILGIEDPLHSLTGRAQSGYVMLAA